MDTVEDRRKAASEARKAQLEKFRQAMSADNPEVERRRAERKAIAEARAAREIEKAARKKALEEQRAAEAAAEKARLEAEAKAAEEARKAEAAARAAQRPKQVIQAAVAYAELRAKRGKKR